MRVYTWQHTVRSYEGDAWGQLQPSGVLRLLERSAIVAAADAGYGREFHDATNTAWIVRRMTLRLASPARSGDELEIATWASHFARVRAGREYRVTNLATRLPVAEAIAEWVYVDRSTGAPKAIPAHLAADFDVPGAPVGHYEPPPVDLTRSATTHQSELPRTAEWYECDSMGHVNNAVYADWLDSGLRHAMHSAGWDVAALKARGYQLRAEHLVLDYKRAALPGDRLRIVTRLEGVDGRLWSISSSIVYAEKAPAEAEGAPTELVCSQAIYGWFDSDGVPCGEPAASSE